MPNVRITLLHCGDIFAGEWGIARRYREVRRALKDVEVVGFLRDLWYGLYRRGSRPDDTNPSMLKGYRMMGPAASVIYAAREAVRAFEHRVVGFGQASCRHS